MKKKYGLITFKSTNYALQAEQVFKEEKLIFKTIHLGYKYNLSLYFRRSN